MISYLFIYLILDISQSCQSIHPTNNRTTKKLDPRSPDLIGNWLEYLNDAPMYLNAAFKSHRALMGLKLGETRPLKHIKPIQPCLHGHGTLCSGTQSCWNLFFKGFKLQAISFMDLVI